MSYDEFPDEYAILKRSLEQEDYDRAESVLLMILKNKSDFQQAQLDLERVRGKLGSIANYEFRVKAFLDQKDTTQAARILEEAQGKFNENRKIKALIAHYEKLAGAPLGGGSASSSAPAPRPTPPPPPGAPNDEDDDDLPNLQTFVVDPNSTVPGMGGSSPSGGKVTPGGIPGMGGGAKQQQQAAGGGGGGAREAMLGGAAKKKAAAGQEEEPQQQKGKTAEAGQTTTAATTRGKKQKRGTTTRRSRSGTKLTYGDTLHRRMDLVVVISIWALVLLLLGGLAGFLGTVQDGVEQPEVGELPGAAKQVLDPMTRSGPGSEEQEAQLVLLYNQVIGETEGQLQLPVVEAYYRTFGRIAEHTEVIDIERLNSWRTAAYERQERIPPIDPEWLEAASWDPQAIPPHLGVEGVWENTRELLLTALFFALIPGLLLGAALAYCTMPLINRVFDALWEAWYALPSVALLYLGYAGLAGVLEMEASATFAAALVGIAMVPHVAFHARQGFENVRSLPAGKQFGLGAIAVIAALAATAARFLLEAVLVVAVLVVAAPPAGQTAGLVVLDGLQALGLHHVSAETFAQHSMYSLALMFGFFGFAVALGLSVFAQLLQVIVAALGLKSNRPAPHELPDTPQQSPVALRNVLAAFVGILVLVGAVVLLLAGHSRAEAAVDAEVAVASWFSTQTFDTALNNSMILGLAGGGAATVLGLVFALVHTGTLSTRRARAWFECAFRVPLAIPPIAFALIAFVVLGTTEPSMTVAILVAAAGLTPLAAVVLMSTFERTRRGPFVPDSAGNVPHGGLIAGARIFEVLGTAAFVSAVGFGSYALLLGLGPTADGAQGFATLPAGLLELTTSALNSEATHTYYTHLVGGVLLGVGASFALRLLAEFFARLALLKRS